MYTGRPYNTFELDKRDPSFIWKMTVGRHQSKLFNEGRWFAELPSEFRKFIPIVRYAVPGSMMIEKINGDNLYDLIELGLVTEELLDDILDQLSEFLHRAKNHYMPCGRLDQQTVYRFIPEIQGGIDDTYNTITRTNMDKKHIKYIDSILGHECLWATLKHYLVRHTCDNPIMHGALNLTNILWDVNNHHIKLIDPEGSFYYANIYGHNAYEWAKIACSFVYNYDYIIHDIETPLDRRTQIQQQLIDWFNENCPYDRKFIDILCCLLFISLVDHHSEDTCCCERLLDQSQNLHNICKLIYGM